MHDELYFWHADKHRSLLQLDTIILVVYNQACPNYSKEICISLQHLQKSMGYEIDFLPVETKIFYKLIVSLWLWIDSHAQSTQNNFMISLQYLKQVHDIFAISQGKRKGWSWFLLKVDFLMKVSSKWYYHFRCVWPDMPKLPKIKRLLFLCNILRKKLIFCMQVSMKTYYKVILWFWWGWSSSQNSKFEMSLQYLKKEVRDEEVS